MPALQKIFRKMHRERGGQMENREKSQSEITQEKKVRMAKTHRVGSITLGLALVLFGSLFLLHMVFPTLDYRMIFHLWPCIFILLGIEVLLGNRRTEDGFVYDKAAIALIVILALFAMTMGAVDFSMERFDYYVEMHW